MAAASANIGRTWWLVVFAACMACGQARPSAGAPAHAPPVDAATATIDAAMATTASAQADADVIPLPDEPWFADRPERTEECLPPLAEAPRPHFPEPFARCEPRAVAHHDPPGGNSLHFFYRSLSVARTQAARAAGKSVCCYVEYRFPAP